MKADIERLIALQELLQLKRDVEDKGYRALGFETTGGETIDEEIEHLKSEIARPLLRRYETIAGKYARPMVPVHNGVCYGCFVQFPVAKLAQAGSELLTCESCGRLLYPVG